MGRQRQQDLRVAASKEGLPVRVEAGKPNDSETASTGSNELPVEASVLFRTWSQYRITNGRCCFASSRKSFLYSVSEDCIRGITWHLARETAWISQDF